MTVEQTLNVEGEEDFLRLRYRGRGANGVLFGRSETTDWGVDVYCLPRGADGLKPVLVHVEEKLEPVGRLSPKMPRIGESVTACWIDRQGNIERCMMPPAAVQPVIDPLGFLMPMPEFASPEETLWAEGLDDERWLMRLAPDQVEGDGRMIVDAEVHSVGQRLKETKRYMRLHYDRRTGKVLRVETHRQGHWRRADASAQCDMELVGSERIPRSRLGAIEADLKKWDMADRWVREMVLQYSATPSAPAECGRPTLDDLPYRIEALSESLSDPLTRIGLSSGIPALHTDRARLVGVEETVAQLRHWRGSAWELTDLNGVNHRWDDYRGKPLVMGFLCRGTPEAIEALTLLDEVRERFSEDQLGVIGFVTTHSRANAEAIRLAVGARVPMFHDFEMAKQLKQFEIGIPSLLLLDGEGRIRFVHTWYPIEMADDICAQVQQLHGLPTSDDQTLRQLTSASG